MIGQYYVRHHTKDQTIILVVLVSKGQVDNFS